jgi:hypothetical protein
LPKQTPKETPAGDERGSLARPPWLTGEKKRGRVHLGRGNRPEDAGKQHAGKAKGDGNRRGPAKPEEQDAKLQTEPQHRRGA